MRYLFLLALSFVMITVCAKTPVVLISIDGFANHYLDKFKPKNIQLLANSGTKSKALLPVYPSKTFPNHLSIVTGKYPQEHGLVHNKFYHKGLKENYYLGAGKNNSAWLTAKPIWSAIEEQGLTSAIYFWPESETKVNGKLPSYFFPYKHNTPNSERVDQVIKWLKLPKNKRPSFIAMYFSTVDSAGHHYGQNSPELAEAINGVDSQIGRLIAGIDDIPVNIILVSDHGMTDAGVSNEIIWQDLFLSRTLKDDSSTHIVNGQTQLYIYESDENKLLDVRSQLSKTSIGKDKYRIYAKENYPKHWHFDDKSSQVIPDLIVDAIPPNTFANPNKETNVSTHGYDPKLAKSLEAIFIANGPDFRVGKVVEPFKNVYIYSIISRLLNLDTIKGVNRSVQVESQLFKE